MAVKKRDVRPVITYPRDAVLDVGHLVDALGVSEDIIGQMDLPSFPAGARQKFIWGQVVDGRDAGSPAWHPEYRGGEQLTVMGAPDEPPVTQRMSADGHVVYLTHPSDPVTWASFDALWKPPTWMGTPRGYDVPQGGVWAPGVTFTQELFDLMFADMDESLRHLGIGDLSIGRQVKRLAGNFYARLRALDRALATVPAAPLAPMLRTNVYHGAAAPGVQQLEALAGYVVAAAHALHLQATEDLLAGQARWRAPDDRRP